MNKPMQDVQMLTQLEERLLSLRIAFAQIWELGHRRSQVGLTGSIINVPVDTNVIQRALPLPTTSTTTIAVSLKRRLEYKNAFQKGMVRPNIIMQALQELIKKILYKMEHVKLNRDWKQALQTDNKIVEKNNLNNTETECESDTENDPSETLVHGFTESINIHKMQDKLL